MSNDVLTNNGKLPAEKAAGKNAAMTEKLSQLGVLLSLILLKNTDAAAGKPAPVKDNVDYNDAAYLDTMPFLPLPWSGFDQGHGRPTPAPDPT